MVILDIKTPLDKLGKSQYWLAKESGINPNRINKMYKGKAEKIGFDTINRLCSTLNCNVGDIIIYTSDTE